MTHPNPTTCIRLATLQDAEAVQAIYAPIVLHTPISFETVPPSADEIGQRIQEVLPHLPWLVCEHENRVLGYAYAGLHRKRVAYQWSCEVSVYVDEEARGRGVGRALYTSLLQALTLQGFINAYAGIVLPNAASVGLHETLGFEPLAVYRNVGFKDGVWESVGWWSLALHPYPEDPSPPDAIDAIAHTEAWQAALDAGLPYLRL